MNYQEFRNTYKALLKASPEVSNLYQDDQDATPYTLTIEHYEKRGSRWKLIDTDTRPIGFIHYCNTVDPNASAFMRSLGGWERTTRTYTRKGYLPTECISINPDRTKKTIRRIKFESMELPTAADLITEAGENTKEAKIA